MVNLNEKRVIALGFFDSLHKGHVELLKKALKKKSEFNAKLLVFTFGDEFLSTLGREDGEVFLYREREAILKELGVDEVVRFPTDKEFFRLSPLSFLDYVSAYNPVSVVVGEDYKFGYKAEGNVKLLSDYFSKKNIEVFVHPLLFEGGKKIASTTVRNLLFEGKIEEANEFLSKKFFYSGYVKRGRGDGRKVVFPTINLEIEPHKIVVKNGVYYTNTKLGGKEYLSITNVGNHPTFNDKKINVETYVFDYEGNAYDDYVIVEFNSFIRDIRRFDNPHELREQIEKDIEFIKKHVKESNL